MASKFGTLADFSYLCPIETKNIMYMTNKIKLVFVLLLGVLSSIDVKAYDANVNGFRFNVTADLKNKTCYIGGYKYDTYNGHLTIPSSVTVKVYVGQNNEGEDLFEDNTLRVIGVKSFSEHNEITGVTIPNTVTEIADDAFYVCPNLSSLTIPNSVTTIGKYAFAKSGLKTLTIPNSVKSIGYQAFGACEHLKSVSISNNVTTLEECVFAFCPSLETVSIPSSIITIGEGAFKDCTNLKTITLPNSIKKIGDSAFWHCSSLQTVEGGNGIETIDSRAFEGCENLISAPFPNTLSSIGDHAFQRCKNLKSVTISSNVTEIKERTFWECSSLKSISIPNSVSSIKLCAFWYCTSLEQIEFGTGVKEINHGAFFGCDNLKSVTIPNSLTVIDESVFQSCDNLESVTIPNSVKTIERCAFESCKSLKSIHIPNSVTYIGEHAFGNCRSLTSVYIPNSVTSIGEEVFYECKGLQSVYIPKSVKTIGDKAFWECVNLRKVVFHSNVENIGESAFLGVGEYDNPCNLYMADRSGFKGKLNNDNYFYWYRGIFCWDNNEVKISPAVDNTNIDYSNKWSNGVDLDGIAEGNIYYSLKTGQGDGYDVENGCLIMKTPMSENIIAETTGGIGYGGDETAIAFDPSKVAETAGTIALNQFIPDTYSGIIAYQGGGESCGSVAYMNGETTGGVAYGGNSESCGSVGFDFQTSGNQQLCVKVGGNEPIVLASAERTKYNVPFQLKNDTYIFIYASQKDATSARKRAAASDCVKLYGINFIIDEIKSTDIITIRDKEMPTKNTWYSLEGTMINTPTKGINIIRTGDGKTKKVILK